MKQKRGQFYLVAAIVIISLIVGFSVVSNYATNKEVVKLYDLKEELGIESANVLKYGTYQSVTDLEALLIELGREIEKPHIRIMR